MFGVETDILNLPLFEPLPACEYSMMPALPDTSKGGSAQMMSGSRSQLVDEVSSHMHDVASDVLHWAKSCPWRAMAIAPKNKIIFMFNR